MCVSRFLLFPFLCLLCVLLKLYVCVCLSLVCFGLLESDDSIQIVWCCCIFLFLSYSLNVLNLTYLNEFIFTLCIHQAISLYFFFFSLFISSLFSSLFLFYFNLVKESVYACVCVFFILKLLREFVNEFLWLFFFFFWHLTQKNFYSLYHIGLDVFVSIHYRTK